MLNMLVSGQVCKLRDCQEMNSIGLFAPRAGQHFRDEQRRRRSQYDRGTRMADLEDCFDTGNLQRCLSVPEHRFDGNGDHYQRMIGLRH